MQASQSPTLVPLPFAANGTKNTIPEASQITITPGAASLNDGFPPLTFTPIAAGGVPPAGADFNGILNLITQTIRWQHAGGGFKYNSAFANDSNVGGYPAGAVLQRSDNAGFWLNLADNNTTNPDATDGSAANWAPLEAYGITAVTGLSGSNVTLTPAQFGLPIITLSGTLAANIQIIFPALKWQWMVVNNTTGAFTVTCKTASGTGVVVQQGGAANVYGDGTNIVLPNALQIGNATQSGHAVPLGQMNNGTVKGIRGFTSSGTFIAPVTGTYYVSGCAGGSGGGGGGGTIGGSGFAGGGGGAGGSAGQWVRRSAYSLTTGQTVTVTIGAAGSGGSAGQGSGTAGGNSSAGGNTTLAGAISLTLTGAVASGGGSGMSTAGAAIGNAGAGGSAGSGYPMGQAGGDGAYAGLGGMGASSPFGGGGGGGRASTLTLSVQNGASATGYGAGGGGGGASYGNSGAQAAGSGGSGSAGYIEFEW